MKDDMKDHAPEVLSATTIIGNDVVNKEGKTLGEVEEIMFDRHTGDVAYAVLSFGGFLGMGEKYFAVPWRAMTVNTVDRNCILDVAEDRLKNAPGFDKDDWPASANREFLDQVHKFYDVQPYYSSPS